jgi:dolichyl-phosphate-mannose-protein mannosyltransferase
MSADRRTTKERDGRLNLSFDDTFLLLTLTAIAAAVRLYRIDYPTSVVFDEVHFGGFATKYVFSKIN